MNIHLGLFFSLWVSLCLSQTIHYYALATETQIHDPPSLFSASAFGLLKYNISSGEFYYNVFVDGVQQGAVTAVQVFLGTVRQPGDLLLTLSLTDISSPTCFLGTTDPLSASLNETIVNGATLYLVVTASSAVLIGDFNNGQQSHSGSFIDPVTGNPVGSFYLWLDGGPGLYQIHFIVQHEQPTLPYDVTWRYPTPNVSLAILGNSGDRIPVFGSHLITDDAQAAFYAGTTYVLFGSNEVPVQGATVSTFQGPLVPMTNLFTTPMSYVFQVSTQGPYDLRFTFNYQATETPDIWLVLTTNVSGTPTVMQLLDLSTLNVTFANESTTVGFGDIPDEVYSQIALGLASGTAGFLAVTPLNPNGEFFGNFDYSSLRWTVIPVCKSTWFIANENAIPVRFSLSKMVTAPAQNGLVLQAFSHDFFTSHTGYQVNLKVASQTSSRTARSFYTRKNMPPCLWVRGSCQGRWNIYPSSLLPFKYSWNVTSTLDGSLLGGSDVVVNVTRSYHQVSVNSTDSNSVLHVYVNYDRLETVRPSALQTCAHLQR